VVRPRAASPVSPPPPPELHILFLYSKQNKSQTRRPRYGNRGDQFLLLLNDKLCPGNGTLIVVWGEKCSWKGFLFIKVRVRRTPNCISRKISALFKANRVKMKNPQKGGFKPESSGTLIMHSTLPGRQIVKGGLEEAPNVRSRR